MQEKALTVTQLSMYFKQIFDAEEMLFNIKVVGEISGLSIVRGVAYFILKDENATMSCVCFNVDNFNFQNGDSVVLTGTPRYYVKGGKLNFNVSKISKSGLGELYQKFLELKNDLELKGYFDTSIKKPLPKVIKRIGVITSKEGAVIQDIINVRTRRNPYIDIVLYSSKVQGVNAEYEIANGISVLENYDVDLIIIARGGGSLEDLQPFNTKVVADAVYNCKKFILSAVGHETDFTICDFCSDLRAPTPSVAAELVCENVEEKKLTLQKQILRLQNAVKSFYISKQSIVIDLFNKLKTKYNDLGMANFTKLNNLVYKLKHNINAYVDKKYHLIELLKSKLEGLEPNAILKLGYASVKIDKQLVKSVKQVELNSELEIKLSDGTVKAYVKGVKGDKNEF